MEFYKFKGVEAIPLFVVKIEYPINTDYEIFTNLKQANERFFELRQRASYHRISKMEIRAIYGVLGSDELHHIEQREVIGIDNVISTVKENYEHAELLRIYPPLKKLNQILSGMVATKMSEITGISERMCEDILIIDGRATKVSKATVEKICNKLNLSIYLFFE